MKKLRRIFLLLVMGAFGLATLIAGGSAVPEKGGRSGKPLSDRISGDIIYILDRAEDVIYEGAFSKDRLTQTYDFSLDSPSRVRLQMKKFGGGIPNLELTIINRMTGEQIGHYSVGTKDRGDFLMETNMEPGFYRILASTSQVRAGSKKYEFLCSAEKNPSTSNLPELTGDAKVSFQKTVSGEIDSERESDYYRFHSYFDQSGVKLSFFGEAPITEYTLLSIENDRYVTLKRGTITIERPEEGSGEVFSIPHEGDYFLVFGAGKNKTKIEASASTPENASAKEETLADEQYYTGEYHFQLRQNADSIVTLSRLTLLPGERTFAVPDADRAQYASMNTFWENSDPSICTITSRGTLTGLDHGTGEVIGYGADSSGRSYKLVVPVRVEFEDVRDDENRQYYYDSVYWAVDRHISSGIKDEDGVYRCFDPNSDCTRAQTITFLYRMAGSPEPEGTVEFTDISPEDYFYKAVIWANENGITGGYKDGTFRPNEKCTRGQVVTFLYRMAGCPEVSDSEEVLSGIIDVDDEDYFRNAVAWASEKGITGGYKDGTFRPEKICNRGQMVTFLYRYDQT